MDVSECPWCGLINPPQAQRCDCGYDFTSGDLEATYIRKASQAPIGPVRVGLNPAGVLFGWVGILFVEVFGMLRRLSEFGKIASLPQRDDKTAREIVERFENTSRTTGDATAEEQITSQSRKTDSHVTIRQGREGQRVEDKK